MSTVVFWDNELLSVSRMCYTGNCDKFTIIPLYECKQIKSLYSQIEMMNNQQFILII